MYTLTLLENMQKNVRESAEVDNKMVHTERCLEFTKLPREELELGNPEKPKEDDLAFSNIRPFPIRNGQISAQRVNLRYSLGSPWVLRHFNIDIQAGEKIGLAGRTGCGKSSFLNVVLRMYDYDGLVLVDGRDIKSLSLASLRKGVSIMTQFPILFSMTLRQNLDLNQSTRDDELWRALEMVGLKDVVLRMPQGIDTEITPHSLEWSAGQKQLFCMARTLLEGRKIVLMDKPTSSLDNVTGKMLWDKVMELLKDCTVVIVSHMPSQLTFCNRIVVSPSSVRCDLTVEYAPLTHTLDSVVTSYIGWTIAGMPCNMLFKDKSPLFLFNVKGKNQYDILPYSQHVQALFFGVKLSKMGDEAVRKDSTNLRSFKLILVGESTAGKTSLAMRYVKGQFHEYQMPTVGAAFFVQKVNLGHTVIKFEIWDTGGQERYNSITPMFFKDAEAAIIVYDITSEYSFQRAKECVNSLKRIAFSNIVIALAGNKIDLSCQRVLPYQEAKAYADDYGLLFVETSAKTAINVSDIFWEIAKILANDCSGNSAKTRNLGLDIRKEHHSGTEGIRSCCRWN